MNRCVRAVLAVLILALVFPASALAHEFLLKPVQLEADLGMEVPLSVVSAHVFMISEEMEPLDLTEVEFVQAGKSAPVKLTPNEVLMTLDGRIKPSTDGTAILAGHRKGAYWTKTTTGWKQAPKKGLDGVISSGLYEKFCKTLFTAGKGGDGWDKVLGQKLEIVPLTNPSLARPGDDVVVRILLDGKPASPESVMATYDGFTMTPNSYAYFTEPYGEGLAKIKITHPGTWMIRTQCSLDGDGVNCDKHVIRSVLIFEVK